MLSLSHIVIVIVDRLQSLMMEGVAKTRWCTDSHDKRFTKLLVRGKQNTRDGVIDRRCILTTSWCRKQQSRCGS